jgi:hypothetical protein
MEVLVEVYGEIPGLYQRRYLPCSVVMVINDNIP